ncbi:MAG: FAD-dependent oxidoreductase [Chroococcidiopsidaceae cyanobacterium CP_BM_RX_35]|nr:FAD-dependent oxidoreductase [Chroococcidiopsidaceae cyanobacterium CP_BM_RX_35]
MLIGGLSGLIAARNLHRSGRNVLLIEARDRFVCCLKLTVPIEAIG